jgi:starvation-inducible DNA-binding protein
MTVRTSVRCTPADMATPSDLDKTAIDRIATAINIIVADAFVLYVKTKNFHWHLTGPNFRDYHVMLDEQADQIFASIDPLAERIRKIGGTTLRSIGHISKLRTLKDSDALRVPALEMLTELLADNKSVAMAMREAHALCDENEDVATASLLEVYIDETERRTWFLFESSRAADSTGH